MKKNILLMLLACLGMLHATRAQTIEVEDSDYVGLPYEKMVDSMLHYLNLDLVPTGLLLEKAYPTAQPGRFNGSLSDTNFVDHFTWRRLYGTLRRSFIDSTLALPRIETTIASMESMMASGHIPIAIINYNYSTFKPEAVDEELLELDGYELHDVEEREELPYEDKIAFAAAPGIFHADSPNLAFVVPQSLYFSNSSKTVDHLEINFGDGLGYRTAHWEDVLLVDYDSARLVEIIIKVVFTDDSWLIGHSHFKSGSEEYSVLNGETFNVTADVAYNGAYGAAKVTVAYGCGNTKLMKPFIIVEGFDPPQNVELGAEPFNYGFLMDNILDFNPALMDKIEAEGYDIVFVDFANGSDYIQRNAYTLVKVIQEVNSRKHANGSELPNEIMGISMGGLVARYALAAMQTNSLNHETKDFISLDVPHEGANMPLGIQSIVYDLHNSAIYRRLHHTNWITSLFGVSDDIKAELRQVHLAYEVLNSPAARQMLIHHIIPGASLYNSFFAELNNLGTTGCNDIAISNGSGNGSGQPNSVLNPPFYPHAYLLGVFAKEETVFAGMGDGNIKLLRMVGYGFTVDIDVWALPDVSMGKQKVYDGEIRDKGIFGLTTSKSRVKVFIQGTNPFDNAPGGCQGLQDYLGSSTGAVPGLTVYYEQFCFIPTISALKISYPQNLDVFFDVSNEASIIANNYTPFNSYRTTYGNQSYSPGYAVNEGHMFLNLHNGNIIQQVMIPNDNLNQPANIYNTQTYNFGKNTSDRIRSVNVKSGGLLKINVNTATGLSSGTTGPNPDDNTTFKVYTNGFNCAPNGVHIIAEGGSEVIIGDPTSDRIGELYITKNSSIELMSNCSLTIYKTSRLIIEKDAELIIHPNTYIRLIDDESNIEIAGTIILEAGADFTFTDNGYIKFDFIGQTSENIISNGSGTSVTFQGNSKLNDKVVEVVGGSVYPDPFIDLFTIKDGYVEMNTNTGFKIGSPIHLENTIFKKQASASGTYVHNGIILNGQSSNTDIFIKNCDFLNANCGVKKEAAASATTLTIENSVFKNCIKGLWTIENGVDLKFVRFENCSLAGWKAEDMSHLSDFKGFVINCGIGIDYEGSSSANLFVSQTQFKNNSFSVQSLGNFTATFKCNKFEDNYGNFEIGSGCTLNLSCSTSVTRIGSTGGTTGYGGDNKFINTLSEEVNTTGAYDLLVKDGYNTFSYTSNPGVIFTGSLTNSYYNTNAFDASNNYWSMYDMIGTPHPVSTLVHYPIASSIQLVYNSSNLSFGYSPALNSIPDNCVLQYWDGEPVEEDPEGIRENTTGMAKNIQPKIFLLYPNPANNILNLRVSEKNHPEYQIKLIDISGRVIQPLAISQNGSGSAYDISGLAPGLYQCIIEENGIMVYKNKLVILR
ncbi:MAG: T9SS type A sorting domain-containing protein [Bacteroidia bacterium]|nr:T9SS type A sorting domain-containing protein [Bacteroidia bacterium]